MKCLGELLGRPQNEKASRHFLLDATRIQPILGGAFVGEEVAVADVMLKYICRLNGTDFCDTHAQYTRKICLVTFLENTSIKDVLNLFRDKATKTRCSMLEGWFGRDKRGDGNQSSWHANLLLQLATARNSNLEQRSRLAWWGEFGLFWPTCLPSAGHRGQDNNPIVGINRLYISGGGGQQ